MRLLTAIGLFSLLIACPEEPKVDTSPDSSIDSALPDTGTYQDQDGDTYDAGEDCNDHDAAIYPGAEELCDGKDNDCDGSIDEGVPADAPTWYADADGDGYGTDTDPQTACTEPRGYSEYGGDCDDTNATFHPGAQESDCTDPLDYNCDGSVGYADADGDGFAACEDCNDNDALTHEDADETCDGADNDCDGDIDEDATDAATWYGDADGDGYGGLQFQSQSCDAPTGYVANSDDCDDVDASAYPGAAEVCDDVDNDCDGTVDEGVGITWYADADGDGYGDASSTTEDCHAPPGYSSNGDDCNDNDPSAHPGSFEICDTIDNDCDGDVDESDAINASAWYADTDNDGYGDPSNSTSSCDMPTGYASNSLDCNDVDPAVSPAADEFCDSVDNDCDGTVDEDDAINASTWYADADSDGYGDPSSTTQSCTLPNQYVGNSDDCNDDPSAGGADQNPGLSEIWYDGVDQNCDGNDNDQDGDATVLSDDCDDTDASSTTVATDADCDTVLTNDDCDDTDASSTTVATDADCDGTLTADDCDDNDPAVTACPCTVNPTGTTLISTSEFCDPNPPSGWTQCAGWTNTTGNDVSNSVLDGCLNSSNRLRIRAWDSSGVLEEDVYSTTANVSQWQSWNYLGGSVTKQTSTYWTGNTTYFTTTNGGSACYGGGGVDAPNGTLTLGTGNAASIILAPGATNEFEYRINCQGSALPGRSIALYK